jgi:hypothetical protein
MTEESRSFLKKSTKKLLSVRRVRTSAGAPEGQPTKVFWCFFSKKNGFL